MERPQNFYLKVYESIKIVKGYKRNLICSLQDNKYLLLNDTIFNFITKYNHCELSEIYNNCNKDIFNECLNYLIENDFAFFCLKEEIECFTVYNNVFQNVSLVDHLILDINDLEVFSIQELVSQINLLKCKFVQIRFYSKFSISDLIRILESFNFSTIVCIEIIIQFSSEFDLDSIKGLFVKFLNITSILVHSSPLDSFFQSDSPKASIIYTKNIIQDETCCGNISPYYFSINNKTFFESQNYNTCLNRKISIDVNGNIKNCPSMKNSFGNIATTSLLEAIEMDGFKDLWYIHKDQIEVCKDCEFRHICTDCRAYIQDPNNKYSKPAKCSYNPYTATWGDENPTNNPLYGQ